MPLFFKHDKKLLYVHVPKCAGTSIERALSDMSDFSMLFFKTAEHEFPCNPQHFHATLLRQLINQIDEIPSFAVVRHPLLRALSEHSYQAKMPVKHPQSFKAYVDQSLFRYAFDSFTYDNHIRAQIQFILSNTKIFRLEQGLSSPLVYCANILSPSEENEQYQPEIPSENKSRDTVFEVKGKTIRQLQQFYAADYLAFGYKTLAVGNNESLSSKELKAEIQSQSFDEMQVNAARELISTDYHQSKLKPSLERAHLLLTRTFKAFSRLVETGT